MGQVTAPFPFLFAEDSELDMLSSQLIHFLDKKIILGQIISQNSGFYPTQDEKLIQILDRIFTFEMIKKLSVTDGQG